VVVPDDDKLDVETALEGLNHALALELRGAVELTLAAGGATGLQHVAIAPELRRWAAEALADAGRLVDKVVALGGTPTADLAEPRFEPEPEAMLRRLLDSEEEAVEALRRIIPATGSEGRGEALEHLLEHLILRKQDQADFLRRALGGS
jgi:bacterioferritin (cytochrome b1)